MRIISSFKDYYDVWLRDGEEPVWNREPRVLVQYDTLSGRGPVDLEPYRAAVQALHEMPKFEYTLDGRSRWDRTEVRGSVLVLCGKIYGFYDGGHPSWASLLAVHPNVVENTYHMAVEPFRGKNTDKPFAEKAYFGKAGWERWVEAWHMKEIGPKSHIAADTPVYLVTRSRRADTQVEANPHLKTLKLTQYLDATDVAQQIDMYMGNELVKEVNPIPVRSQILIRDAHGFDDNSFKNTKPDRRERKR